MNFGTALGKKRQETCQHQSMLMIQSHGIKRHICEDCGHVSFAFLEVLLSEIDRDRFARPVDQLVGASS